jgi:hypothetical protein
MMIISNSDTQQDTVRLSKIVIKESIRIKTFSLPEVKRVSLKDTARPAPPSAPKPMFDGLADTTSVCMRNPIADLTFNDSANFIFTLKPGFRNGFPYSFTEKNRVKQEEENAILIRHLKPGEKIAVNPLHDDWIILIILISSFLYSLIRTTSKNLVSGVARVFMFRGINGPSPRDIGRLFNWQSTILNLASFLVLGLFVYCFALYNDFVPSGIEGIKGYLISFGIIITAITLRHIACLVTGNLSGERELFSDYLLGIYQSYRLSAIFLLIIVILLSYTLFLPVKVYFISGIIALGLIYILRITRLFIIFINRNISIFYLILYLCALEILPVGISVKYFTGLF